MARRRERRSEGRREGRSERRGERRGEGRGEVMEHCRALREGKGWCVREGWGGENVGENESWGWSGEQSECGEVKDRRVRSGDQGEGRKYEGIGGEPPVQEAQVSEEGGLQQRGRRKRVREPIMATGEEGQ
jgi:hypothetical protein